MLDYPGRPMLTTVNNDTSHPQSALLRYLPPLQTAPLDLLPSPVTTQSTPPPSAAAAAASATAAGRNISMGGSSSSSSSRGGGSSASGGLPCPQWNEALAVDADHKTLAQQDALLLLEVLQPAVSFKRYQRHRTEFGGGGGSGGAGSSGGQAGGEGSHPVAWAFLRIAGPVEGQLDSQGQVPVQLQLYQYDAAGEGRGGHGTSSEGGTQSPEGVYWS